MEKRNFGTGPTHEELGKGAFSIVYESGNLVLKFDHRDIPRIFKAVLGKKTEDDSGKLESAIEALKSKNPFVLDELEKLDDLTLKSAIIGYYENDTPNLDVVIKLLEKYLATKSEPLVAIQKHKNNTEQTKENYGKIVKFFGRENVLDIKVFKLNKENLEKIEDEIILNVIEKIFSVGENEPITKNDWNKIKEFINDNNIEIPIIIQEKFATDKEDSACFCSEIPTSDNFKKEVEKYQNNNNYANIKEILDQYINRNELFFKLEQEKEISESLKDFIIKTIRYTKETHSFIDFWGGNNVIFFKEDEIWKYKLLDPVVDMKFYSEKPGVKSNNIKDFIIENRSELRHIYTYIKTLNLCAEKLGLQDRLVARDILGAKVDGIEQELEEFLK